MKQTKNLKNIKVALVHEMLVKMGGAERVLDSLQKIFPEATIFTLAYDEKKCGEIFPKEKVVTSKIQKFLDWGVPRQFLVKKMPEAIEDFDFSDFDVVISSSSAFAHGLITPSGVPHICYVHAPMRYVWDYTHEYVREKTAGWRRILRSPLLSLMHTLRIWDAAAASRPDLLLANSQTTQKRIQKFWRRDSQVVYPPVDTQKFSQNISSEISGKNEKNSDEYYCIVSALEPFKKIDIAIEAFVQPEFSEKKLIVIGDGSAKSHLENIAKNAPNIQFLGRKNDAEVVEYIQQCKAFVFPGLEDFGITPVEAMSAGKPVIFYNKGGVSESVINGETGIAFEKQTAESLVEAVEKFESEKIQKFLSSQKMKERAEEFSEKIFTENILKAVDEMMKKGFLS